MLSTLNFPLLGYYILVSKMSDTYNEDVLLVEDLLLLDAVGLGSFH